MSDVDKLLKALEIVATSLTDDVIKNASTEELMRIEELKMYLKTLIDSEK